MFLACAEHRRLEPERIQLRTLKESPVGPRFRQELLQCSLDEGSLRIIANSPVTRVDARNTGAFPRPQLQNPLLFKPEQGMSNDRLGCPNASRQPGDRQQAIVRRARPPIAH